MHKACNLSYQAGTESLSLSLFDGGWLDPFYRVHAPCNLDRRLSLRGLYYQDTALKR